MFDRYSNCVECNQQAMRSPPPPVLIPLLFKLLTIHLLQCDFRAVTFSKSVFSYPSPLFSMTILGILIATYFLRLSNLTGSDLVPKCARVPTSELTVIMLFVYRHSKLHIILFQELALGISLTVTRTDYLLVIF